MYRLKHVWNRLFFCLKTCFFRKFKKLFLLWKFVYFSEESGNFFGKVSEHFSWSMKNCLFFSFQIGVCSWFFLIARKAFSLKINFFGKVYEIISLGWKMFEVGISLVSCAKSIQLILLRCKCDFILSFGARLYRYFDQKNFVDYFV